MGCTSSKQSTCRHCQAPCSPIRGRSFSMSVHHSPENKVGSRYHSISVTSSTLGSIKVDIVKNSQWDDHIDQRIEDGEKGLEKSNQFAMGMVEAKAWSKMIDEKIPKVFPRTPMKARLCEPEIINVEELMEGLEDTSPFKVGDHFRSLSFHVSDDLIPPYVDYPIGGGSLENGENWPKKTIWFDSQEKENSGLVSKGLVSELDPEVISSFRKALEELSPRSPLSLKSRDGGCDQQDHINGIMDTEVTEENVIGSSSKEVSEETNMTGYDQTNGSVGGVIIEDKENLAPFENGDFYANGLTEKEMVDDENFVENGLVHYAKKRVVFYFTSLRGVRKTYEDCCYVRLTLKGLGIRVDERDVSMHSGFKEELKELLGEGVKGALPKVFVGDKYIGGMEEIRRLHEDGVLEKVVEGCEMININGGNLIEVCEGCGDIRFVPCETCSGSCKIYYEIENDEQEFEEDEYGFRRCPDCNENGLVRCPVCCY